jgi:hypothetical protein
MPSTLSLFQSAVFTSFAALLAIGCAATSANRSDEQDIEAAEEGLHASCANRQAVPLVTEAEHAARYQKFLARNGSGWKPSLPAWGFDMVTGAIAFSSRIDAMGPAVPGLTKAQAESAGKAFILKNWDLVGFRSPVAASHATAEATAVDAHYSGGGFSFRVLLDAKESQPGYEDIEGATQELQFGVDIANDGTARQFSSVNGHLIPFLTMSTTPKRSVQSAKASVIGFPLSYRPGPYELDWGTVYQYGAITPADIVETELAVAIDHESQLRPIVPNTRTLRMMHKLSVERPGVKATFYIDTCNGQRIGDPAIYRTN